MNTVLPGHSFTGISGSHTGSHLLLDYRSMYPEILLLSPASLYKLKDRFHTEM
jgi:hypothetical protein